MLTRVYHKEGWVPKNWYFWTVVLEKTLESPLNCMIKPVHSKGDQFWVFTGRTDVEAETPILWPLHVKGWLIWKDPDGGKEWGQKEKGTTEDEMVGWHHWLNGHGFGWILGTRDGQGGLACCDSQGRKESDTTEQLNWTGNHCRWWLQPWNQETLAPWKKSYDKPRKHIKKQRYYFADKGPSSQTMVFPVVMYGCESQTIKKAVHWIIDAFELWCWRRLLRVPWTARRSNQSILKEISPEFSLEGLMLKLKLQYSGHLLWRIDSFKKTLMLGEIEGRKRREWRR